VLLFSSRKIVVGIMRSVIVSYNKTTRHMS